MKESILLKEIQLFLTRYCQQERHLSRLTILSYRDTMKLFLNYLHGTKKLSLSKIELSELTYELVSEFLTHLEKKRGISVSTRNQRLSAVHSFLRYLLFKYPDCAGTISRTLNVPKKKVIKRPRSFLSPEETEHLLKSVNRKNWIEKRDYLLLDFCIRTGIRVSELVNIKVDDIVFGKSPYVTVTGKGRKERSIPIDRSFSSTLDSWIQSNDLTFSSYLFSSVRGRRLSTDSIQYLLRKYVSISRKNSSLLIKKKISPHTLRHTTAMNLLSRAVDIQIIALWLGHEQIDTTQIYLSGSMSLKRKALEKTVIKSSPLVGRIKKSELDFLDEI